MNVIGEAIDELYRYFSILNKEYYDSKLPDPVITIQKTRPNNLGHFTLDKVWKEKNDTDNDELAKYEININPLNLNRTAQEIITTVHHEMVHYANRYIDVKDCNGQIHNKKFKAMAESVGLICEKGKYGWGTTYPDDSLIKFINETIRPNEDVFRYFRSYVVKEKKTREKKTFKYICPGCELVAKAERDKKIKCGTCEIDLVMED
jgi:predicted SprT family Zn-dependent metalloprotease